MARMVQAVAAPSVWVFDEEADIAEQSTQQTHDKHVAQTRNKPLFPSSTEIWNLFVATTQANPLILKMWSLNLKQQYHLEIH